MKLLVLLCAALQVPDTGRACVILKATVRDLGDHHSVVNSDYHLSFLHRCALQPLFTACVCCPQAKVTCPMHLTVCSFCDSAANSLQFGTIYHQPLVLLMAQRLHSHLITDDEVALSVQV